MRYDITDFVNDEEDENEDCKIYAGLVDCFGDKCGMFI